MSAEASLEASAAQHSLPADLQSQHFLEALTVRRSIYALSPTSRVPDDKIEAIVRHALLHVPNAFNAQTTRCLLLLGAESQKFWDNAGQILREQMGEEGWKFFAPKIDEYKSGYGSCCFFDDTAAWDEVEKTLGQRRWEGVKAMAPQWEEHSAGMHHYAVWTALSLEGLAGNLQHYNMPNIEAMMKETWSLPATWKPKAQLVFGTPVGGPRQVKTFKPVDGERLLVRKA